MILTAVISISVLAGMAWGLSIVNHWLGNDYWKRDFLIGFAFLAIASFIGVFA
jgi:hypothetical protein